MKSRRTFIKQVTACIGTGALCAFAPARAADSPPDATQQIHKRPIPKGGEMLPVLGVGTSRVFDVNMAEGNRRPLRKVLGILFSAGGSVIDTAHAYHRAEAVVGDLLADLQARKQAFLSSKVYATGHAEGLDQINLSFKRLKTEVIDLYLVHNLVGITTQFRALQTLKEQGKIRYIGVSHYSADGIDRITDLIKGGLAPDFVQFPYSLSHRHAENHLLPLARDRGIAAIANQPFSKGLLFSRVQGKSLPPWAADIGCKSWAQFFLKYIIGNTQVNCVIPGTGNPVHAHDNVAAGMGHLPDHREREQMVAYWNNL